MFCHLQPSPYDRKTSMFLCSFSQPAVLGEVVSLVCFLWHSLLSINSLYMSSTLALRGEEGHYGPSSVPAPRGGAWARLPVQAEWEGSLAQSTPFRAKASPATNGGGEFSVSFRISFQHHAPGSLLFVLFLPSPLLQTTGGIFTPDFLTSPPHAFLDLGTPFFQSSF